MEAWEHQTLAINLSRQAFADGAKGVCIAAPCGSGKTFIGCEVARMHTERGGNVLWLAHRHELVDQASERLTVPARVETVQGLLASGERPDASMVVFDEAHHFGAGAVKWHQLSQSYQDVPLVGLTATPERGDGTPLSPPFDHMVVGAHYSELLTQRRIVPAEVWAPPKRIAGISRPLDAWKDYGRGLRTVVFCANVEHAKQMAEEFGAVARARHVSGDMPMADRNERLDALRDGQLDIVTNVHLLTEGFDDPAIECVVLARGFSHVGSYLQAVGRALRASPGKTRALVLDLVGAVHDHGLPDQDREYSLTGKAITQKRQDQEELLRHCQWCGAVFRGSQRNCPRCGRVVAIPKTPQERKARLERVRQASTTDSRALHFRRLREQAMAKGYKPGWAAYRYKSIYKEWPRSKP